MPSNDKKSLQVMLVFSGIKKSGRIRDLYNRYKKSEEKEVITPPNESSDILDKLESLSSKVSVLKDEITEVSNELNEMINLEPGEDE